MDADPRVTELTSQVLESARTPEEVCRECPELLEPVRRRLAEHRRVHGQIHAWFPSDASAAPPDQALSDSPDLAPDLPGYEVETLLGRGGMGLVYRARHLRLNRSVAIKLLPAGARAGMHELERFFREAEAVAGLQHPNIVQVHDVGECRGQPYFTMELVEGGSLLDRLAGTPQPARHAAALVATLAGAVHAAHERGIVHRDLKPSNILLAADGTPKISDFGLAHRTEANGSGTAHDLTFAGSPIGTPSYMSPEQAEGRTSAIGPATDVYSLGAILYEMLTGRPPFRGESPADTRQHVIDDLPVPPSRLNPKTPRNLETVCLKCLEKDPRRRYASAMDLAEDLRRFGRGEPVAARRASAIEKAVMWVQRRPTAAALYAMVVLAALLTLTMVVGLLRAGQQRAATVAAVQSDLQKLDELQRTSSWDESQAVVARAQGRLAGLAEGGPVELRQAVSRAAANLTLALRLEAIRFYRAPLVGGLADPAAADRDYEAAFREAGGGGSGGLNIVSDDSTSAAARVGSSGMAQTLVAGLDDWAVATQDDTRRAWCLGVARQADEDPTGWRARLRDPKAWADRKALAALATSAPINTLPLPLLLAVGERLQDLVGREGGEAVDFLKRIDREHPGDPGVNFRLGYALMHRQNPAEAAVYFRTAFALRPQNAAVCNDLGYALKAAGQLDDAIAYYRRAILLDPNYPGAHSNLGVALKDQGKPDEAMACFQRALEIDPTFAQAHHGLARLLGARGDIAGAIEHLELAAKYAPTAAEPHYNLGVILAKLGRTDEAIAHYEEALRLAPGLAPAHGNLGNLLADRKQYDQALAHLRRVVELAPSDPVGHGSLGLVLLAQGKTTEAKASLSRALELMPPNHPGRAEVERKLKECEESEKP